MEKENIANIVLRESARALPWGVMLLVVIAITGMWLKQEIKEAIQYSVHTAIQQSEQALLNPHMVERVKQNTKEAIQYTAHNAADEYVRAQQELRQKP